MLTCLPRPRYAELLTDDSSMHRGSMIRNHFRRITNICWNGNDNPTGGEVWKEDPNIEHLPDYFCWWLELLRRIPLLIIISPLIPQLTYRVTDDACSYQVLCPQVLSRSDRSRLIQFRAMEQLVFTYVVSKGRSMYPGLAKTGSTRLAKYENGNGAPDDDDDDDHLSFTNSTGWRYGQGFSNSVHPFLETGNVVQQLYGYLAEAEHEGDKGR